MKLCFLLIATLIFSSYGFSQYCHRALKLINLLTATGLTAKHSNTTKHSNTGRFIYPRDC